MKLPKRAAETPSKMELEQDKKYAWCTCGLSEKQTLCDGSHKSSEMRPLIFEVDEDKTAHLCNCKQTKNPPYCDGSHKS
ncbi:MAG: CDGSH iron-sulfur domain-containing protein [Flavobacteriales bacterium]|jgi:CDGSH iron-sulfur domain-containing protein 3|nr:CDGSH iron-sulfur domain-containing protein [Flavobacteriales bacterium]